MLTSAKRRREPKGTTLGAGRKRGVIRVGKVQVVGWPGSRILASTYEDRRSRGIVRVGGIYWGCRVQKRSSGLGGGGR